MYLLTHVHVYGLPPNGHDGHIFRGAKLILAQKAILHIIECVLVYCVGRPLSLQLEYQHTIVVTWVHKYAHTQSCMYHTCTCTCRYTYTMYMYHVRCRWLYYVYIMYISRHIHVYIHVTEWPAAKTLRVGWAATTQNLSESRRNVWMPDL